MTNLTLYIANKNYSSWSLRAWLALQFTGLSFKETIIPLGEEKTSERLLDISPSGKVPCLHHDDLVIWESLSIMEYLHELQPEKHLLPKDKVLRAIARSAMAEMHAGFFSLRSECPMNMRRRKAKNISSQTMVDIERIYQLWDFCQEKSGHGEFLLGGYGAIDMFFAPVVSRIISYQLPQAGHASYIEKLSQTSSYRLWAEAAAQESWRFARTDQV